MNTEKEDHRKKYVHHTQRERTNKKEIPKNDSEKKENGTIAFTFLLLIPTFFIVKFIDSIFNSGKLFYCAESCFDYFGAAKNQGLDFFEQECCSYATTRSLIIIFAVWVLSAILVAFISKPKSED